MLITITDSVPTVAIFVVAVTIALLTDSLCFFSSCSEFHQATRLFLALSHVIEISDLVSGRYKTWSTRTTDPIFPLQRPHSPLSSCLSAQQHARSVQSSAVENAAAAVLSHQWHPALLAQSSLLAQCPFPASQPSHPVHSLPLPSRSRRSATSGPRTQSSPTTKSRRFLSSQAT